MASLSRGFFLVTILSVVLSLAAAAAAEEEEDGALVVCLPPPAHTLSNGVDMPRVSFGTAALPRGRGHERVIAAAAGAGFRAFDTAQATEWYDEASVARALNATGLPRSAFFVTTKLHPRDLGYTAARQWGKVKGLGESWVREMTISPGETAGIQL